MFVACAIAQAEQAARPPTLIDKGACPSEGCGYGKRKVIAEAVLYARPNIKSKRVAKCAPGSTVLAITGEVHSTAGEFRVKKRHGRYKPGDTIWVYTYIGEGYFKIWFDGSFGEEELGFSPYGGTAGKRCESSEHCWGEITKELDFKWWVQFKNAAGQIGWSMQHDSFQHIDPP